MTSAFFSKSIFRHLNDRVGMHKLVSPLSAPLCFFGLFLVLPAFSLPGICSMIVTTAQAETYPPAVDTGHEAEQTNSDPLRSETPGTDPQDGPDGDGTVGSPAAPGPEAGEPADKAPDTIVDMVHAGISRGIQGTASWMDSFFGDWRYASELNESYIRFRYNVFLEEAAKMYRKPDLQARFVLPQLREKTHIVLSGTPRETSEFSAVHTNSPYDQITNPDERNVSAALQQTFLKTAKQNFTLRAGAKLHASKPVLIAGPRYRVLFDTHGWGIRFTEEALWTSDTGWEARSIMDLEHPLPAGLFFRTSNQVDWVEDVAGYVYAFSFNIGQPLSARRGIDYEWINVFHTKPVNELVEVSLRIRYRQRLWRDWLFFETAPQYRFPRDRSFKSVPGILFRLDMLFGDYQ